MVTRGKQEIILPKRYKKQPLFKKKQWCERNVFFVLVQYNLIKSFLTARVISMHFYATQFLRLIVLPCCVDFALLMISGQ